jgi:hypothetical protein
MNFNYSYNSEEDSVVDLICDMEVNHVINAINNDFGCSMFSDLIKDMAVKTCSGYRKEKLKATKELKETFRKMIKCFPPDLLEKHHLRLNAEVHKEYNLRQIPKHISELPSDEDIEHLWKTKRQERRRLQQQVIAGGSSLKRKGLNSDVVEHICKKLKPS